MTYNGRPMSFFQQASETSTKKGMELMYRTWFVRLLGLFKLGKWVTSGDDCGVPSSWLSSRREQGCWGMLNQSSQISPLWSFSISNLESLRLSPKNWEAKSLCAVHRPEMMFLRASWRTGSCCKRGSGCPEPSHWWDTKMQKWLWLRFTNTPACINSSCFGIWSSFRKSVTLMTHMGTYVGLENSLRLRLVLVPMAPKSTSLGGPLFYWRAQMLLPDPLWLNQDAM